jgi:hypothetical protein
MTTISALIPRLRWHRSGSVVAIRCAVCRTWRKPKAFNCNATTCHYCSYAAARRRVTARAARRG